MPQHPAIHPDDLYEQAHHDFNFLIARQMARRQAQELARVTGRAGDAHKHLIAAHLWALCDGMGDDDALAFLDRLIENFLEGKQTAMRAKRG